MKTLTLITLFFAFSSSICVAQDDNPDEKPRKEREKLSPEERADKRTDKMTEILGLTNEGFIEFLGERKISFINTTKEELEESYKNFEEFMKIYQM